MHWLVFDTIDSIKEQDLHMNYFIDASTEYKNVICQTYVLIGKIPDNKHFGGLYTVKTLYNVTRYNRIFNIQQKIAGNGSVSI